MNWLKQNWFKVGILLLILLAVMTAFQSYKSYLNRKEAVDELRRLTEEAESKREYEAQRKSDCLDIYKVESDKWNNVRGWRYDEDNDFLC